MKNLTIKEYALLMGVTPAAIRMRIMRGKELPGVKKKSYFGKNHLFEVDIREAKKYSSI